MLICCFDAAKLRFFFRKRIAKTGKFSVKTGKQPFFPILAETMREKRLSRLSRCHAMLPDAWFSHRHCLCCRTQSASGCATCEGLPFRLPTFPAIPSRGGIRRW